MVIPSSNTILGQQHQHHQRRARRTTSLEVVRPILLIVSTCFVINVLLTGILFHSSLVCDTIIRMDGVVCSQQQQQQKQQQALEKSRLQLSQTNGQHSSYKRKKITLPPRESSTNSAGFVHMGKTGGSTISTMIRNGCNSFADGPCRTIANETMISKLVEHYYHVPDFWRLPTSNHKLFLISVRDVFDRTVSALLYDHPENAKVYNLSQTKKQRYYGPIAYGCFPTLEDFASLMEQNGNSTACNYPYRFNMVVADDCVGLACAAIHGKVRFFSHLFFNYRNIVYSKLPLSHQQQQQQKQQQQESIREIYVIRQEYFWNDWNRVNQMWEQNTNDATTTTTSTTTTSMNVVDSDVRTRVERNVSGIALPVPRSISVQGRERLCKALETEYAAYYHLLNMAKNLQSNDLEDCIQISMRNCPNLDIRSIARKTKLKKEFT